MSDTAFVRTSKVKEFNKDAGFRSDGELADTLNTKVEELLTAAQARARANGRATVRPGDL